MFFFFGLLATSYLFNFSVYAKHPSFGYTNLLWLIFKIHQYFRNDQMKQHGRLMLAYLHIKCKNIFNAGVYTTFNFYKYSAHLIQSI